MVEVQWQKIFGLWLKNSQNAMLKYVFLFSVPVLRRLILFFSMYIPRKHIPRPFVCVCVYLKLYICTYMYIYVHTWTIHIWLYICTQHTDRSEYINIQPSEVNHKLMWQTLNSPQRDQKKMKILSSYESLVTLSESFI